MQQYQNINPIWGGWIPPLPALDPIGFPQHTVSDNDNINIGSGNQIIGGGNPSPVNVINVTTTTYTALITDYFICVDTSAQATVITLPTGLSGTVYIVKDCTGNANTNNIIIQGTGVQLVDTAANAIINSSFGAVQLIFNQTCWSVV